MVCELCFHKAVKKQIKTVLCCEEVSKAIVSRREQLGLTALIPGVLCLHHTQPCRSLCIKGQCSPSLPGTTPGATHSFYFHALPRSGFRKMNATWDWKRIVLLEKVAVSSGLKLYQRPSWFQNLLLVGSGQVPGLLPYQWVVGRNTVSQMENGVNWAPSWMTGFEQNLYLKDNFIKLRRNDRRERKTGREKM